MNAITTRRTLARQPATPPAIRQTIDVAPPVAVKFVAPPVRRPHIDVAPPEPHQPLISTRALDVMMGVLAGALFGFGLAVLTWWAC